MEIIYNGEVREVAPGATLGELLAQLDRPVNQVAVEVNRELVPRRQYAEFGLQAGDCVEVVTLAGGG